MICTVSDSVPFDGGWCGARLEPLALSAVILCVCTVDNTVLVIAPSAACSFLSSSSSFFLILFLVFFFCFLLVVVVVVAVVVVVVLCCCCCCYSYFFSFCSFIIIIHHHYYHHHHHLLLTLLSFLSVIFFLFVLPLLPSIARTQRMEWGQGSPNCWNDSVLELSLSHLIGTPFPTSGMVHGMYASIAAILLSRTKHQDLRTKFHGVDSYSDKVLVLTLTQKSRISFPWVIGVKLLQYYCTSDSLLRYIAVSVKCVAVSVEVLSNFSEG